MRVAPGARTFIALWTVATATGFGLGWTLAAESSNGLFIGVALGVSQALVLLPRWWVALYWVIATSLGWAAGVTLLAALYGPSREWSAYLGCLPFITIPALTLVQWLVVRHWFKSESFILWFGASVCSFPVAGFLSIIISLVANPGSKSFIKELPHAIAPTLWLMGGIYGFFLGLALAAGAPDLYRGWREHDGVAATALGVSVAGFAAITAQDAVNAFSDYDLIYGQNDSGLFLLRILVYLALGFSLSRFRGVGFAIAISFAVAIGDIFLYVATKLSMGRFTGFNRLFVEDWPDFLRDIAVPVVVWTVVAAIGGALSRTRLSRLVRRSGVYRVKI